MLARLPARFVMFCALRIATSRLLPRHAVACRPPTATRARFSVYLQLRRALNVLPRAAHVAFLPQLSPRGDVASAFVAASRHGCRVPLVEVSRYARCVSASDHLMFSDAASIDFFALRRLIRAPIHIAVDAAIFARYAAARVAPRAVADAAVAMPIFRRLPWRCRCRFTLLPDLPTPSPHSRAVKRTILCRGAVFALPIDSRDASRCRYAPARDAAPAADVAALMPAFRRRYRRFLTPMLRHAFAPSLRRRLRFVSRRAARCLISPFVACRPSPLPSS